MTFEKKQIYNCNSKFIAVILAMVFKICLLVQQINDRSCKLIENALIAQKHRVIVIQYYNKLHNDNKSWKLKHHESENSIISPCGNKLNIIYFDAVMLRSWGSTTEALEFLAVFAKAGITMCNDYASIKLSQSKVNMYKNFELGNVDTPLTSDISFDDVVAIDMLDCYNNYPCIVKPDISTAKLKSAIVNNYNELSQHLMQFKASNQKSFVLQDYVNHGRPKNLHKALIIGGKVYAVIKLTYEAGNHNINMDKNNSIEIMDFDLINDKTKIMLEKAALATGLTCLSMVDYILDGDKVFCLKVSDKTNISVLYDKNMPELPLNIAKAFTSKIIKARKGKGKATKKTT